MESETLPYKLKSVYTTAFNDQNPGTSGLRKKVTHFQQKNYIENFVQSLFNAHNQENYLNKSLIVGGDGRFYNEIAANIIIKIAAANGIRIVILAENCIMSTPAISLLIRNQPANECFGAFILTASHNPGGPHEDLGIKFNNAAGAPAPENVTAKLFQCTKDITSYKILDFDGNFSLINDTNIKVLQNDLIEREFTIRIESSTKLYVEKMQELFDFDLFKTLFEWKSDIKVIS